MSTTARRPPRTTPAFGTATSCSPTWWTPRAAHAPTRSRSGSLSPRTPLRFGRLLLATLTPGALDSYLAVHGMPQLTPLTVTDRWELQAELDQARVDGLVAEVEEFQSRSASLAAPVRDGTGAVVAAIAVSVPAAQFEQRRCQLAHIVRQGASQAGALLTQPGCTVG